MHKAICKAWSGCRWITETFLLSSARCLMWSILLTRRISLPIRRLIPIWIIGVWATIWIFSKCWIIGRISTSRVIKSQIIELAAWLSENGFKKNPFTDASTKVINTTQNHTAKYNDIMIFKNQISS